MVDVLRQSPDQYSQPQGVPFSRRQFLAGVGAVTAGALSVACAPPTPTTYENPQPTMTAANVLKTAKTASPALPIVTGTPNTVTAGEPAIPTIMPSNTPEETVTITPTVSITPTIEPTAAFSGTLSMDEVSGANIPFIGGLGQLNYTPRMQSLLQAESGLTLAQEVARGADRIVLTASERRAAGEPYVFPVGNDFAGQLLHPTLDGLIRRQGPGTNYAEVPGLGRLVQTDAIHALGYVGTPGERWLFVGNHAVTNEGVVPNVFFTAMESGGQTFLQAAAGMPPIARMDDQLWTLLAEQTEALYAQEVTPTPTIAVAPTAADTPTIEPSPTPVPTPLRVDGARFMKGVKEVILRGADTNHYYYPTSIDNPEGNLTTFKGDINILRGMGGIFTPIMWNSGEEFMGNPAYIKGIVSACEYAHSQGVTVELALRGRGRKSDPRWDSIGIDIADQQIIADYSKLLSQPDTARRLAAAVSIFNPFSEPKWTDSTHNALSSWDSLKSLWTEAAQEIRLKLGNPDAIIAYAPPNRAGDLRPVAAESQLGHNTAIEVHPYKWVVDETGGENAFLSAIDGIRANGVQVFVGEMGLSDPIDFTERLYKAFVDRGISFAVYALNTNSNNTDALAIKNKTLTPRGVMAAKYFKAPK